MAAGLALRLRRLYGVFPTARRGSIVVLVDFPLLEAFGEQVCILDDFTFEQAVEFVGIHAV